jgi:hypothetical protein
MIIFLNGDTTHGYQVVVRKDTTRWLGKGGLFFVPSDSVAWVTGDGKTVTLHNGSKITCYDAEYGKDTTTWRGLGKEVAMPTDSVLSIHVETPAVGTGMIVGLLGGALLGVAGGAGTVGPPGIVALAEGALGVVCGLAGAIIGGIIGANN